MSSQPRTAIEHFNASASVYEGTTGGCTRDVARDIVSLCPPFSANSTVLDNACGPGIAVEELFKELKPDAEPLEIYCVDGASAMVDIARERLEKQAQDASLKTSLHFDVMSGEKLTFPDDKFTHSITNLGILFFSDPLQGAQEIYRTLKSGGTAIITTWSELGYLKVVHQAQEEVKPGEPLFRIPIPPEWLQASHVDSTLRDAGFKDLEIVERKAYYGADSKEELLRLLAGLMGALWKDWSEADKVLLAGEMSKVLDTAMVNFQRPSNGGNKMMVGLPMKALLAVARK